MSKIVPKPAAKATAIAMPSNAQPIVDVLTQNEESQQVQEDQGNAAALIGDAKDIEMQKAFEDRLAAGTYCIEKAKELGFADHPKFKPKTAPYLKIQHEFECIDEDKTDEDNSKKIIYRAHKYGKCVNCKKHFDQCRLLDMDAVGGLFYCENYSARANGFRRQR